MTDVDNAQILRALRADATFPRSPLLNAAQSHSPPVDVQIQPFLGAQDWRHQIRDDFPVNVLEPEKLAPLADLRGVMFIVESSRAPGTLASLLHQTVVKTIAIFSSDEPIASVVIVKLPPGGQGSLSFNFQQLLQQYRYPDSMRWPHSRPRRRGEVLSDLWIVFTPLGAARYVLGSGRLLNTPPLPAEGGDRNLLEVSPPRETSLWALPLEALQIPVMRVLSQLHRTIINYVANRRVTGSVGFLPPSRDNERDNPHLLEVTVAMLATLHVAITFKIVPEQDIRLDKGEDIRAAYQRAACMGVIYRTIEGLVALTRPFQQAWQVDGPSVDAEGLEGITALMRTASIHYEQRLAALRS